MKSSRGFSLVELMVAMLIGLVIILGAGQLFLTGFKSFGQVEKLGNKQAVLTFASETLIRDIRRAEDVAVVSEDGEKFQLVVKNRNDVASCEEGSDVTKRYWVEENNGVYFLRLWQNCAGLNSPINEPLVEGFSSNGFPMPSHKGDGVWRVTFRVQSGSVGAVDEYLFYAVNRSDAVNR